MQVFQLRQDAQFSGNRARQTVSIEVNVAKLAQSRQPRRNRPVEVCIAYVQYFEVGKLHKLGGNRPFQAVVAKQAQLPKPGKITDASWNRGDLIAIGMRPAKIDARHMTILTG